MGCSNAMSARSAGRQTSASFLALSLALWAAFPSVQWCPAGWGHFKIECFVGPMRLAETCSTAHGTMCCRSCAPRSADESRAYCLSDPNGGLGLRPLPPRLHAPAPAVLAVLVAVASMPSPVAIRRAVPRETARPPTDVWIALPPVRGPPRA
jgi:hypothetical protein